MRCGTRPSAAESLLNCCSVRHFPPLQRSRGCPAENEWRSRSAFILYPSSLVAEAINRNTFEEVARQAHDQGQADRLNRGYENRVSQAVSWMELSRVRLWWK